MKQYTVLTQSDKVFGGKFDAAKLQEVLNAYAKEGWIVISMTSQEFPLGFGGKTRQELIVVLEANA